MSAFTNMAAAQRERERRQRLSAESGGRYPAVSQSPEWDAFFGSLHDQEEAANAAGMNYRVNLGSLGRPGIEGMDPAAAPRDNVAEIMRNDEVTRRIQAENAAQEDYNRQRQQGIINDLYRDYDQSRLEQAFQPPPSHDVVTGPTGPPQPGDRYTIRPGAQAPQTPDEIAARRQRALDVMPASARPIYEKQWAEEDMRRQAAAMEIGKFEEAKRHNMAMEAKPSGMAAMTAETDPKAIAEAVQRGDLPPDLNQYSRYAKDQIASELAKMGFNLSQATTDWRATQKHIASLNSTQQLRLNQAVDALPEMLDTVEDLAKQWKAGRFPLLNRGNLALAKNGVYGKAAASIATQLESQIADVTGELGQVIMGGNSPTDHALELASKNLSGNWEEGVLLDAVARARKNVGIRRNSILNTGVAGASADNPYAASPAAAAAITSKAGPKVGDVVSVGGKRIKISAIHPDGSFDGDVVK